MANQNFIDGTEDGAESYLYFAVPPQSDSTATFRGQYLRLENYYSHTDPVSGVTTSEDYHVPSTVQTSGLKGINISATGYLLVNTAGEMHETFGGALTETITSGNAIVVSGGDWELVSERGDISFRTTDTAYYDSAHASYVSGIPHRITLKATDCDMYFTARDGTAKYSDERDKKTSTTDTVGLVCGFELAAQTGEYNKSNSGFALSINPLGDYVAQTTAFKFSGISLKYVTSANSITVFGIKAQLIATKLGLVAAKRMLVYNKINYWQIYNEEILATSNFAQIHLQGLDQQKKLARVEKTALKASFKQVLMM